MNFNMQRSPGKWICLLIRPLVISRDIISVPPLSVSTLFGTWNVIKNDAEVTFIAEATDVLTVAKSALLCYWLWKCLWMVVHVGLQEMSTRWATCVQSAGWEGLCQQQVIHCFYETITCCAIYRSCLYSLITLQLEMGKNTQSGFFDDKVRFCSDSEYFKTN